MKSFLAAAVWTGIFSIAVAQETEVFDLEEPPLPEPGKRYVLAIEPGKDAKPVRLIFVAGTDPYGTTDDGKVWTNIDSLIQEGVGKLPIETEGGVVYTEVADFDLDGYRDLQVLSHSGSGGSWYNYYRFDGSKYVSWPEPEELGINVIQPENSYAAAFSRSGPCWFARYFRIENGHFVLYGRDVFEQARNVREMIPAGVPDSHYVRITDRIRGDRVVHRKVEVENPWGEDSDAKTVIDEAIDELVDRPPSEE